MSETRANHLWSYLSRPENRGLSTLRPCCSLPQGAHDGATWAEILGRKAAAADDIPLLETASRLAGAEKAEAENARLRAALEQIIAAPYTVAGDSDTILDACLGIAQRALERAMQGEAAETGAS